MVSVPAALRTVCECADGPSDGVDREQWQPWYRLEGLTVFFGTTHANEDAVLVSFIARAPPKLLAYVRIPGILAGLAVRESPGRG